MKGGLSRREFVKAGAAAAGVCAAPVAPVPFEVDVPLVVVVPFEAVLGGVALCVVLGRCGVVGPSSKPLPPPSTVPPPAAHPLASAPASSAGATRRDQKNGIRWDECMGSFLECPVDGQIIVAGRAVACGPA